MENNSIFLIIILTLYCYYFSKPCYSKTDTLRQGQQFKDGDYLISTNWVFSLKFFGFGTTISPYLGVFYYQKVPNYKQASIYLYPYLDDFPRKAVWVANINNSITYIYANLMIDIHGKLSILSSQGTVLDLFSPTPLVTRNASATLLDSGNLVLHELNLDGSVKRVYGKALITQQTPFYQEWNLVLISRLGTDGHLRLGQLPAHGSFTLTGDRNGTGQLFILRHGNIHRRSGPWKDGLFKNT